MRRTSRTSAFVVAAATALSLVSGVGGAVAAVAAPAAVPAADAAHHAVPTPHQVLNRDGKIIDSTHVAQANANAKKLSQLNAQHAAKVFGTVTKPVAPTSPTSKSSKPRHVHLPAVLAERQRDHVGTLPLKGVVPPTARTLSAYLKAAKHASALGAAHGHGRAVEGRVLAGALLSAPSTAPATAVSTGSISGTVTDKTSGSPLPGVCVTAYDDFGDISMSNCTDASGHYSITGLPAGTYYVQAEDHVSSHITDSLSQNAVVQAGADSGNQDIAMVQGGSVAGHVTDPSNNPLKNVCVNLDNGEDFSAGGCTDASGFFQTTGAPAGSYAVSFYDTTDYYESQWYSGKTASTDANKVAVTVGSTTTGIDASMVRGGSISGTLTGSDGSTPVGICGQVDSATTGDWAGEVLCSDATGHYTTSSLPSGSYKIEFTDRTATYLDRWYANSTDEEHATSVPVVHGADTTNVNMTMPVAGHITGTVVDAADGTTPLQDVCVESDESWHDACTDADGHFDIGGLDTGSYHLTFYDDGPAGYLTRNYHDVDPTVGDGDAVTVTQGITTNALTEHLILGGRIAGQVVNSNGDPLADICVETQEGDGSSDCTDANGNYTIVGLPAGAYHLEFQDDSGTGYLSRYYRDVDISSGSTGDSLQAALSATTQALVEHLVMGGTITGTLTAAIGGGPVQADVELYDAAAGPGVDAVAYSETDDVGHYVFRSLETGSYKVLFRPYDNYLATWYGDAMTAADATPVTVTRGVTTSGIDAAAHSGGVISGTVTDAATGAPIANVCVDATAVGTEDFDQEDCSAADGTYSISGLLTDDYTVKFDGAWAGYVPQTLPGSVHAAVDTTTTHVDGHLIKGGTISGVISDAAGHPIVSEDGNPCASALDSNGEWVGASHCADDTGAYTITGLPAGDYPVVFNADRYLVQYYNNAADVAHATSVHVDLGGTIGSINAALTLGADITGIVTDAATGQAPASPWRLEVDAYDSAGNVVGASDVDDQGHYDISRLPSGSYTINFVDNRGEYATQWYDGAASQASATPVNVVAGQITANIDAALNDGGSISGHVTEGSGQPLAGICVQAFLPSDTLNAVSSSCTDSAGAYRIHGLAGGTYLVEYVPQNGAYLPQWANGKQDSGSADFINVTFGQNTANLDAVLAPGATFSGTVTDKATGAPLPGVCVEVFNVDGSYAGVPSTCSDDTGHYKTVGLRPGSYMFEFYGGSDYIVQWWQNASSEFTATVVTFNGTEANSDNDVQLDHGGHITGAVTDGNGVGVGSWVYFYNADTGNFVADTGVYGDDGSYSSPGLPAGNYKVQFSTWYSNQDRWYDAKSDMATADVVTVATGETVSGIDNTFVGTATGSISGTVTDAATGQPLGVCLWAQPTGSGGTQNTCSDDAGHYTFTNVPVGTYTVQYSQYWGPYLPASYTGGGASSSAATVTVADSATTSGIDLALQHGATVSGTIKDAATGQPLSNICADVVPDGGAWQSSQRVYTCSDNNGRYQTRAVSAGSYKLVFTNLDGRYLTQWYDRASDQALAQPLTLATGADTSGINAAMTLGAAISGTVTDGGTTHPVSNVCVTFHDPTSNALTSVGTCTDNTGHYSAVVPAGSYKVQFTDGSGTRVDQWWNGKPDAASADTLTVAAGDARSGVNAVMTAPAQATTGSIAGVVRDSGDHAVNGVSLTLCSTSTQLCSTTTTDSSGAYSFNGQQPGDYGLTAYPPANSGLNWGHTAVQIAAGVAGLQDVTLVATAPLTPAQGVTVNGASTGTPTAFWTETTALAATGCTGGSATYSVTDASGAVVNSGTLAESSAGQYTGNMPALYPNRGTMTVSIAITCPNVGDNKTASFTMYIDPSGTVKDTAGHGIAGATVTLLQSATQNGQYTTVPNGSDVMSPANRTNPDTSDATGHYGWDVTAGWYKVTAQKSDCYAPGSYNSTANTVTSVVSSAAQQIPPAVTNLDLTLDCTNIAPVAALTQSKTSGQAGVTVHFDASGSRDANGSVASYSWDFGDGSSGTGASVDHAYSTVGNFVPTLTVKDDQGQVSPSKTGATIAVSDVPAQVSGITPVPGLHSVSLSWAIPNSHNSAIQDYTVDVSPGGQHIVTQNPSAVISNLTGNATYTFSVTARNAFGSSTSSTVQAVAGAAGAKPTVSITTAPSGLVAHRDGSVSFTAVPDPSVTITSVTCSIDGAAATACTSPMSFSGLGDGSHSVLVTARDSDGGTSSATAQWVVDTVAPAATQTAPTSLTSLGAITVRWAGSDANGVSSYDVRYTKAAWNGKPGAPVSWKSATTATSATFSGAAGYEYCFSTRARDAAGNVSGWSAARCTALPLDDRALTASAGWKKLTVKSAYGRTAMQTAAKGKTLTRKGAAAGRAVLLVTTGKGFGTLVVRYNGVVVKKLSLAATKTHYQVAVALPTVKKANTAIVIATTSAKTVQVDGLLLARV